jgi:hypothetical protein
MSFCGLKPIGEEEFFTSSHDLKVVAINCDNYLTLNLCYNPLVMLAKPKDSVREKARSEGSRAIGHELSSFPEVSKKMS